MEEGGKGKRVIKKTEVEERKERRGGVEHLK